MHFTMLPCLVHVRLQREHTKQIQYTIQKYADVSMNKGEESLQKNHWGGWCLSPAVTGGEAAHTLDLVSPSQGNSETLRTNNHAHTCSLTLKDNLDTPMKQLWEEAGAPGENPCMHRENILTPRKKTPSLTQGLITARQQCYQLLHCAA
ncbi:hypothetical protein CHARACLAT_021663 [Characodon lateralis]|uniref:Prolactin receptor n=1 Tax=Characodon lateralis TaxID=208331 RepID=A0ABU7DMI3_9TELE|nr:hypothetical protein [Characodon lateralis]